MKRILVIDPDVTLRQVYAEALGQVPYEVVTAGSGAEGCAKFAETRADMVFIELKLPDDGVAALRSLCEEDAGVFIAILTGHAAEFLSDITAIQVDGLSCDVYHKPVTDDEIRSIAGKAIGQ